MTSEGDVVLIYHQDQPTVFARLEAIEPDIKKGWYHATLLLLTNPTQVVTWILKDTYIDGAPFTMGGKAVRLEKVERVEVKKEKTSPGDRGKAGPSESGKVIPFKKP